MVLSAQGLSFPVTTGEEGPFLVAGGSDLGAVADFVNEAARGAPLLRDIEERLERREPVGGFPMSAASVSAETLRDADRERWRRVAGTELGDDVYRVTNDAGGAPTDVALVPRPVLSELFRQLLVLRLESADSWLFRPHPIWWQPAPGEESLLRELEARIDDGAEAPPEVLRKLAAAGLFSGTFAAEREAKLMDWGLIRLASRARAGRELFEYLGSFRRLSAHGKASADIVASPVSIELFRRGLPWPAGPERDARLSELEAELDRLAPKGATGEVEVVSEGRPLRVRWRRGNEGRVAVLQLSRIGEPKRERP